MSPHSSLELDADHGDMIDETIKHITQTLNQTLMTSNPCNTNTNRDSSDPPMMIPLIQPIPDVNPHATADIMNTKSKKNTPTQG